MYKGYQDYSLILNEAFNSLEYTMNLLDHLKSGQYHFLKEVQSLLLEQDPNNQIKRIEIQGGQYDPALYVLIAPNDTHALQTEITIIADLISINQILINTCIWKSLSSTHSGKAHLTGLSDTFDHIYDTSELEPITLTEKILSYL